MPSAAGAAQMPPPAGAAQMGPGGAKASPRAMDRAAGGG